jgi:hypothetical protein
MTGDWHILVLGDQRNSAAPSETGGIAGWRSQRGQIIRQTVDGRKPMNIWLTNTSMINW